MSTLTHPHAPAATSAPAAGILRDFHPGWFAAVMGTGIVGITAYLNPGAQAGMRDTAHAVGVAFVLLAWTLAAAITIPYLARLARYPRAAIADLRHPIIGALYATFPAAILVLAVATATVGGSILPAHTVTLIVGVLAAIGAPLAFAAGVLFAYVLFTSDGIPSEAANGGWFIPPVVAIIIPLTFVPLLPHVSHSTGRLLLLLGYAMFGIGLLLFLTDRRNAARQTHLTPAATRSAGAIAVDRTWPDRRRQPGAAAPRRRRAPRLGQPAPPPCRPSRSSPPPRSGASGSGGWRSRRCC